MKKVKYPSIVTTCFVVLLGTAYPATGWAKSVGDKVKEWTDEGAEALKKEVDKLGDNIEAVQEYLDHYHWKGLIEGETAEGFAKLKGLELNGHSRAIAVRPGEKIEAEVECTLHAEPASALNVHRIVIGFNEVGPQVVIGNEWGLVSGKSRERFTLTAPEVPGVYQVRFKPVGAVFKKAALEAWRDEEGREPDATKTIGIVVVKSQ